MSMEESSDHPVQTYGELLAVLLALLVLTGVTVGVSRIELGVLNIWVGPVNDPDVAQPVTRDTGRGIRTYFWAYTDRHVLYLQDDSGDENWRLFCVDVMSGRETALTPETATVPVCGW